MAGIERWADVVDHQRGAFGTGNLGVVGGDQDVVSHAAFDRLAPADDAACELHHLDAARHRSQRVFVGWAGHVNMGSPSAMRWSRRLRSQPTTSGTNSQRQCGGDVVDTVDPVLVQRGVACYSLSCAHREQRRIQFTREETHSELLVPAAIQQASRKTREVFVPFGNPHGGRR
jgi:hypothetical protein